MGGKTRISALNWQTEGCSEGDAFNKADEYKYNYKWNCQHPDKQPKPICKSDEYSEGLKIAEEEKRQAEIERENNLTFAEYAVKYYFPYHVKEGKKSLLREQGIFTNHLKPVIGELTFDQITKDHLETIKDEAHEAGLSKRSANYHLDLVRQVWNRAIVDGKTAKLAPNCKVKRNKLDNARIRFFTREEEQLFLPALLKGSVREHDMALLSLDTGGRWGEVAALLWEHVNFKEASLLFTQTKSGESRTGYMTARVKEMLFKRKMSKNSLYVFPHRDGGILKYQSNTFARVIEKLKLNDEVTDKKLKVSFHTCRHTFASRLVNDGVDLYVVKDLMGHSSILMTERYSHLTKEIKRAAVDVLEAQVKQEKEGSLSERAAKAIDQGYNPADVIKWALEGGKEPLPKKHGPGVILPFIQEATR
ncbi:MAG: site-specific integrase [Proteobacteria bacterium]|nr:site-specific integrase [Pseudomonadota bacterium]